MGDDRDLFEAVPALDDRERRALAAAQRWVGGDIQGVAIGRTAAGDSAVVVYALDAASDQVAHLPGVCEGLPVTVETGDAFAAR